MSAVELILVSGTASQDHVLKRSATTATVIGVAYSKCGPIAAVPTGATFKSTVAVVGTVS